METQILIFVANQSGTEPLRANLDLDKFNGARDEVLPAAYLVKQQDLGSLKNFPNLIEDRGNKHKAKSLSSLLLRRKKIPLIDGKFKAPGQCKRSIRTLLANAEEKKERNLYLIGAGKAIFDSLWEQAGRKRETMDLAAWSTPQTEMFQLFMQTSPACPEPSELAQSYIGQSFDAKLVRQMILLAAKKDHPVLILGDTGTGKEVVARAVHKLSKPNNEHFTSLNCGAVPTDLFESELFGHEAVYTNVLKRKIGLWEQAANGTLFLDEIGDLPLHHQVKILRALQEKVIRRVGGTDYIPVNARVVAATNRDVYSMVQNGQFREDLFYRLRAFVIRTPSLRSHPEDIPLLAQFLWRKITNGAKKPLPEDLLNVLTKLPWPGNVRELRLVLNRLDTFSKTDPPNLRSLQFVLLYDRYTNLQTLAKARPKEIDPNPMDCITHLHRAEEVIRATQVAIDPLVRAKVPSPSLIPIQELMIFRLSEMEMLCHHPLLFHREAVYSAVNQFKAKLIFFMNLLENNSKEAFSFWIRDVRGRFRKILDSLSREAKTLLGTF